MRMVLTHWATHVAFALVAATGVSVSLGLIVQDLRTVAPDEMVWRELGQRPRTDTIELRGERIATAIRTALSTQVQVENWTLLVPPTLARCRGEAGTIGAGAAARAVIGGTWAGDPVPRRQWPAAYRAVQATLGADGFTSVDVLLDDPTEHRIRIDDSQGTTFSFDLDQQRTSFSLESECSLVPGAKVPVM